MIVKIAFTLVCLGVSLFAGKQEIELCGQLVKKAFPAPQVVREPAFGWFLELDPESKEKIFHALNQLEGDERNFFSNLDLNIVQVLVSRNDEKCKCGHLEGRQVSAQGKLELAALQAISCYQLELRDSESLKDIRDDSAFGTLSDPVELPEGVPEVLVALKGLLKLRLCPGPPNYSSVEAGDYPSYCWFLQMDTPSFQKAIQTPVWGYALSLNDIIAKPNWFEVQLGADDNPFYSDHLDQEVVVEGYLFHAHTGHHRAPFLMDVKSVHE